MPTCHLPPSLSGPYGNATPAPSRLNARLPPAPYPECPPRQCHARTLSPECPPATTAVPRFACACSSICRQQRAPLGAAELADGLPLDHAFLLAPAALAAAARGWCAPEGAAELAGERDIPCAGCGLFENQGAGCGPLGSQGHVMGGVWTTWEPRTCHGRGVDHLRTRVQVVEDV